MKTDKLLQIAKEVIDLNKDLKAALAGSLLFVVSGKRIRRNPKDIDIIVQYLCEKEEGFPIVPAGFSLNEMDGKKSDVNAIQFINKDGVKIDFLISDEKRGTKQYKGIDYIVGDVDQAISAKIYFAENDKSPKSRNKHLKDLVYMNKKPRFSVGTKSVLFGAHCFLLHPFFVAAAWIRLFGFPFDFRIWIAFFVHDLGYWGKPNMDGPEGETHVELGGRLMHLFDGWDEISEMVYNSDLGTNHKRREAAGYHVYKLISLGYNFTYMVYRKRQTKWQEFSLYHSRYYAKKNGKNPSKLCYADKLAFSVTPAWLYLPMVNATGEINEYLDNGSKPGNKWDPVFDQNKWHNQLRKYMIKWVAAHKNGEVDNWINGNRNINNF